MLLYVKLLKRKWRRIKIEREKRGRERGRQGERERKEVSYGRRRRVKAYLNSCSHAYYIVLVSRFKSNANSKYKLPISIRV